jgi:hypothetical protein
MCITHAVSTVVQTSAFVASSRPILSESIAIDASAFLDRERPAEPAAPPGVLGLHEVDPAPRDADGQTIASAP